MTVKLLQPEEIYPIRWEMLRQGKPIETARFDADYNIGTFHLGIFNEDGQLVGCLSAHCEQLPEFTGIKAKNAYQFRGMATLSKFQGRGYGRKIMTAMEGILKSLECDWVWCNSRETAISFYESMGYGAVGKLFNIPDVGPHKVMIKEFK